MVITITVGNKINIHGRKNSPGHDFYEVNSYLNVTENKRSVTRDMNLIILYWT